MVVGSASMYLLAQSYKSEKDLQNHLLMYLRKSEQKGYICNSMSLDRGKKKMCILLNIAKGQSKDND